MKSCTKCGVPKELSEFHVNMRESDGKADECKICIHDRYEKNKDSIRERNRLIRYGVTPEFVAKELKKQGGMCAICGTDQPARGTYSKEWSIDHDHVTGKFRGILCFRCNAGLGFFKDNAASLFKAIWYLLK